MNWTLHVSSNQTSSARWYSSIWSKITLILFAHHPVGGNLQDGHGEGKLGEGGTTSGCEKVSPSVLPTHETTRRLPEEGKPGGRLPLQLHHNDNDAPQLARNLWQGCWSRSSCGWGCWSRSLMDKMPPLDMVVRVADSPASSSSSKSLMKIWNSTFISVHISELWNWAGAHKIQPSASTVNHQLQFTPKKKTHTQSFNYKIIVSPSGELVEK